MDDLIHKVVSSRMQESSGACLDENAMAAYLEGSLPLREKMAIEAHLAECSSCQAVLALSMKIQNQDQAEFVPVSAVDRSSRKTLFRFSIPLPVLGGVAAAILVAGIFLFMPKSSKDLSPPQTAELRPPVVEKEIPRQMPQRPESAYKTDKIAIENQRPAQPAAAAPAAAPAPLGRETTAESFVPEARSRQDKTAAMPSAETQLEAAAVIPSDQENSAAELTSKMSRKSVAVVLDEKKGMRVESLERAGKKIGDRIFYHDSGYWVDTQCREHADAPVIELTASDPEYASILSQYPQLRDQKPAKIYWNGKICILP